MIARPIYFCCRGLYFTSRFTCSVFHYITLSFDFLRTPSSFYVASLPHNALGCVSIRIDRFALFLFLLFLFFTKFPFFWLLDTLASLVPSQCTHFFDVCLLSPFFHRPLHLLGVYFPFSERILILYCLLQYRTPLPTSNHDDLDTTSSFDAIRRYNILGCPTVRWFRVCSSWEL